MSTMCGVMMMTISVFSTFVRSFLNKRADKRNVPQNREFHLNVSLLLANNAADNNPLSILNINIAADGVVLGDWRVEVRELHEVARADVGNIQANRADAIFVRLRFGIYGVRSMLIPTGGSMKS